MSKNPTITFGIVAWLLGRILETPRHNKHSRVLFKSWWRVGQTGLICQLIEDTRPPSRPSISLDIYKLRGSVSDEDSEEEARELLPGLVRAFRWVRWTALLSGRKVLIFCSGRVKWGLFTPTERIVDSILSKF